MHPSKRKRHKLYRDFYPYDMNGCVLWIPLHKYGAEVQKAWDQSGNENHGVITGVAPAQIPITGPELISNGGMETGDPPTGWTNEAGFDTFERSSTQAFQGTYSLHCVESVYSWASQTLSGMAGKKLIAYASYYLVSGGVRVGVFDQTNSLFPIDSTPMASPVGYWATYRGIGTVSSSSILTKAFLENSGSSEFYIDAFSVKEIIGYGGPGWVFPNIFATHLACGTGTSLRLTSNMTVLCWIRPFMSGYGNRYIVCKYGSGTGDGYAFFITSGTGKISLQIFESFVNHGGSSSLYTVDVNQWNCIAATYNGSNVVHYKNGAYDSTTGDAGSIGDPSTNSLYISTYEGQGAVASDIGDVLLFNRTLSAQEIKAYYELTRHIYGV